MVNNKKNKRRSLSSSKTGTRTSLKMRASDELGLRNRHYDDNYRYERINNSKKGKTKPSKNSKRKRVKKEKKKNGGYKRVGYSKRKTAPSNTDNTSNLVYPNFEENRGRLRSPYPENKTLYNDSSAGRASYDKRNSAAHSQKKENSGERIRSKTKKVKRNSGDGAKKFAVGIFAIIVVYVIVVGYKFITRQIVPYSSVIMGEIDTAMSVTGIIVRNETLYNAPASGGISFNAGELERVKKGDVVCTIKNTEVVETMEEELEDINKSILQMQYSRDDMSAFSEDVKRVNSQIKDIVDKNVFDISAGDIDKIYTLRDNVNKRIDQKNQMLLSESGGSLSELTEKKAKQESEITKNTTTVSAQQSGIISYGFDGLEESLTIDKLDSLSEEQTLMKRNTPDVSRAAVNVKNSDAIFKIVSGNDWYIAVYMDNPAVEGWQEGDRREIYIKGGDSNAPIQAEIYKLSKGSDKSYVVLKLTKDISDYINQRSISFEINKAPVGYKINNSAIVEAHSLKIPVSYINDDGMVIKITQERRINVAVSVSGYDDNGEFAYISIGAVNANDVLQNPKDWNETFTVTEMISSKGVYVVNTGVTEFKQISLENSSSNSTHTVLDPAKNPNIEVYDRIVTDVKNIEKEERVY